ncbi:MAG: hypothetical protein [Microvirus sp.]|nr:MAG: hypothetical protein [Microvirus sp.]
MKRQKLSRSSSKRQFSNGSKIHKRNNGGAPMRGGIRL